MVESNRYLRRGRALGYFSKANSAACSSELLHDLTNCIGFVVPPADTFIQYEGNNWQCYEILKESISRAALSSSGKDFLFMLLGLFDSNIQKGLLDSLSPKRKLLVESGGSSQELSAEKQLLE